MIRVSAPIKRSGPALPLAIAAFLPVLCLAASLQPAFAHVGGGPDTVSAPPAWLQWQFTPDIVIASLLAALVYGIGMLRRRSVANPPPWWRHAMFFGGIAAIVIALQSPVDPLAEHSFFMHQIQHLLLRMLGPMLLALSWPQGVLNAGLPAPLRRALLGPAVSSGILRRIFGALTQPVIVTALFIAALCVWEIPRYHNAALLSEPIHYAMHVSMLLAGLLFWWRIFDRRPAPQGLRHGARLMMLWIVLLSNIALGAYTALKDTVLYDAYDVTGRVFDIAAPADEKIGGIIIWIPSSMMCLFAVLIVIHLWGRHETRLAERQVRAGMEAGQPMTAAVLRQRQAPKNRALALGFAAFVAMIFAAAIVAGLLSHLSQRHGMASRVLHEYGQHAVR